jgi:hypothetical protein
LFVNRFQARANRLNDGEVDFARQNRLRLVKMRSILREVASYCGFVWMIYTISYSNRNRHAFLQVNHLRQYFLNIGDVNNDFTQVRHEMHWLHT